MIRIKNLDQFKAQIEKFMEDTKQDAQEAAVGLATKALNRILYESPQFTGDFVSSWKVSLGSPSTAFEPWGERFNEDGDPYQKGDPWAIEYAQMRNFATLSAAKNIPLGVPIYISNSAKHDEPYAWKIEKGSIKFRSVNPNASRVVARAVANTSREFSVIRSPKLAILKKVGV